MAGSPEFLSVLRLVGFSLSKGNFPSLNFKPLWSKSFESILKGQDVIGVLPTGSGKSMLFHGCTVLARIKNNQGHPTTECMFPNTPEVSQIIVAFSMLSLETCLANLEFPLKLFICSDVLGELWSALPPKPGKSALGTRLDFFNPSNGKIYGNEPRYNQTAL